MIPTKETQTMNRRAERSSEPRGHCVKLYEGAELIAVRRCTFSETADVIEREWIDNGTLVGGKG